MSEKRKPSGLFALLRRKGSKENNGQATLERQVTAAPTKLHHSRSDLNQKEPKVRKPVERRESSRLQNAAKLLRNLSKSKDLSTASSSISLTPATPSSEVGVVPSGQQQQTNELNRSHPIYHSEGKGARRRRSEGREREVKKDRSHSFHGKVDKKNKYVCNTSLSQASLNVNNAREKKVKEETVAGARSILLTEDNLNPLQDNSKSPDLIQDLPYLDLPPRCGTATPPGRGSAATPPEKGGSAPHVKSLTPPPVAPSPEASDSTPTPPIFSPSETVIVDVDAFEGQLEEHGEKLEEISEQRSVNGEKRSEDQEDISYKTSDDTTYKATDDTRSSDDTAFRDDTRGSDDPTYSTIDERYNSNDSLNQWEETYLQPEEEGHYQDMGGKHTDGGKVEAGKYREVEAGKYNMEDVEDSYVTSLEEERMRDSIPANKQSNNFFSPVNHNLGKK